MATPGVLSNCLFYFISLDSTGKPIPGTMHAKSHNSKIDKGYGCREAILTKNQMVPPAGHKQCFGSNHLRYFYRISPQTGNIIPNSLFSRVGRPKQMCGILEYIVYN